MKARVLHQCAPVRTNPLQLEEVPTPSPAPGSGEVLIRVRACGVCRTDLHVVEGELPPEKGRLPIIPGHQVVGDIVELGPGTHGINVGARVGVAWLHCTCEACRFCNTGRENLCEDAEFTGWTRHGGYAEYIVAPGSFVYPLPGELTDEQAAPLLCAGIIGYRCLRQCGITDWSGAKLGLYGFGAAGHIAIQIARHRGADVYVFTRNVDTHQALARELGATWVGDTYKPPPAPLDAGVLFAPAGDIIPAALGALDRGSTLVCGGIHMSPAPPLDYELLYQERVLRSVANNTREDGRAFLAEAAQANVQTHVQQYPLEHANDALIDLRHDAIRGEAVLMIGD